MTINFNVPLPSAGEGALLTYAFADLEALEKHFKSGYVQTIGKGLNADETAVLRKCLEIGVKGGDFEAALRTAPVDVLKGAVRDALTLRLTGKAQTE